MDTPTNFLPDLPQFTLMFITVYLFAYFVVFRAWSQEKRPEASSSLISLVHGTPAVVLASLSFLNSQTQLNFASPNTSFQNTVLEFSLAYFIMDLLHYLIFHPSDVLFIAHHLATLYVLLTCRYVVQHGASAILGLLILAEITSPCQNAWSLARYRKADSPEAAKLYEFLSPIFYPFYTVVRGVLAPIYVFKVGVFFASGGADGLISWWAWLSWMIIIISALFISMMWVTNRWVDFYKERTKKESIKLS